MGEYEDFVKGIPAAERVPEPFQSVDDRLDFLGPKVIGMKNRVEKLEDALATIEIGGGAIMPQKIEQIPFAYNVLATSGVILTEDVPFSGYIKQVSIHWPDGCNGLVDVKVLHGVKQFCPNNGYLHLNNATPTYPFNEYVYDKEPIRVEIHNADGLDHAITVAVTLEGVE